VNLSKQQKEALKLNILIIKRIEVYKVLDAQSLLLLIYKKY